MHALEEADLCRLEVYEHAMTELERALITKVRDLQKEAANMRAEYEEKIQELEDADCSECERKDSELEDLREEKAALEAQLEGADA